ncbi:MAG TPA: DUF1684 domain-containing protein [Gemmatimonadales bacterium]|nr:DUF1684 domain-containing protein [Gemmatimonadales bacterium]
MLPRLPALFPLACAVLGLACRPAPWPDPPPVDPAAFLSAHESWRANRRAELTDSLHMAPRWAGLWPLPEGTTVLGADTALAVALPVRGGSRVPARVGRIQRRGRVTALEAAPGVTLTLHHGGTAPAVLPMMSDSAGDPTCVRIGTLHLWVHNELGRLYLRAADESLFPGRSFPMPDQFPPDPAWRVAARLEPFDPPRTLRLPDVTAEIQEWPVPGRLVFQVAGRKFRVLPIALPGAPGAPVRMRLMFRDSTSGRETFGLTRYLTVPAVDSTGWTVIDFNRAYNPPCAFTAHSVCVLPPEENRLAARIAAGEKEFKKRMVEDGGW